MKAHVLRRTLPAIREDPTTSRLAWSRKSFRARCMVLGSRQIIPCDPNSTVRELLDIIRQRVERNPRLGKKAAERLIALQLNTPDSEAFELDPEDRIMDVVDENDIVATVSVGHRMPSLDAKVPSQAFPVYRPGDTQLQDEGKVLFELGLSYHSGYGATRSLTKAIEYYNRAAAFGSVDALSHLGLIYDQGDGVPEDKKTARHFFDRAEAMRIAKAGTKPRVIHLSLPAESDTIKPMTKDVPLSLVASRIRSMVPHGTYWENWTCHTNCFLASDLVDTLVSAQFASSRADGAMLGQRLLKHGLILSVSQRTRFRDGPGVFRFPARRGKKAERGELYILRALKFVLKGSRRGVGLQRRREEGGAIARAAGGAPLGARRAPKLPGDRELMEGIASGEDGRWEISRGLLEVLLDGCGVGIRPFSSPYRTYDSSHWQTGRAAKRMQRLSELRSGQCNSLKPDVIEKFIRQRYLVEEDVLRAAIFDFTGSYKARHVSKGQYERFYQRVQYEDYKPHARDLDLDALKARSPADVNAEFYRLSKLNPGRLTHLDMRAWIRENVKIKIRVQDVMEAGESEHTNRICRKVSRVTRETTNGVLHGVTVPAAYLSVF
mmetsp:Transcript_15725/g.29685  ORF Transcript_15725/g.29685 Transcript_15725/m.29685 type:complete len:606 (-) Transcript_15725:1063-2880(-)